jgi:hypothetical protein
MYLIYLGYIRLNIIQLGRCIDMSCCVPPLFFCLSFRKGHCFVVLTLNKLIFLCRSIAIFIFMKNSTVKPHVSELRCSVCRPFVLCCSTTFLLTFRLWLRRLGMRPRGWLVGFLHCPIEHITLSSVKLSFAEVDRLHASGNGDFLTSFNIYYDSKTIS